MPWFRSSKTPSTTVEVVSEVVPEEVSHSPTAALADATTVLLDTAVTQIKQYGTRSVAAAVLKKHQEELAGMRSFIQKIRYQEDLQTPPVEAALLKVQTVMERLVRASGGATGPVEQLNNIMEELQQAVKNLRQRLPGDVFFVQGSKTTRGFQNNASIGGERGEGRLFVEATANEVEDGMQVNAPIYGDPRFLLDIGKIWAKT